MTPPAPVPPPLVPIVLDLGDPVVEATVAGVAMRLRVDFQQKDVIELNPAAAARLAVAWEEGFDVAVGRVILAGRQARAAVAIGGVTREAVVAEHGRDCCAGVDGAISPVLLPYDPVRLVRRERDGGGETVTLPASISAETGLTLAQPLGREVLRVRLTLDGERAIATASAGAVLAKAYGGRFAGPVFKVRPAFGIERQARTMRFATPAIVAGFALREVAVRFADFSGGRALPVDEGGDGAIEVLGKAPAPQRDWPSISLGRDMLDRCREIAFHQTVPSVTLDCKFGG